MIEYRTLEGICMETLCSSFVRAFSDYQIKMEMPVSKLELMLKRRGYAPELSMGAFDGGNLVGFILNGHRIWGGIDTVYDSGTGVIPEYRKQGITNNIFKRLQEVLIEKGAVQYLLEVLKANTPALKIYQNAGFNTTRSLLCYKLPKDKAHIESTCHIKVIDRMDLLDWNLCKTFWDQEPSWQNSIDSVNEVPSQFVAVEAIVDGEIAGYGIAEKETGDVPQIAVSRNFRLRGIGKSIIDALRLNTNSDSLAFINVDERLENLISLLKLIGADKFTEQHEMMLKL